MRFVALDSWRGVAALLVALFHFPGLWHFYDIDFVRNSWLFVDFFFVLSGFVISHADYKKLTHPKDALPFMIRRFGRVWPLHAVLLLAFVAFPLLEWWVCRSSGVCGSAWPFTDKNQNITTFFSNLLLLHSLGIHDDFTWNVPSWSISTEFYTYAFFAILLVLSRRVFAQLASAITIGALAIVLVYSPNYMEAAYDFGWFRCVAGFFSGFLTFRLFQFSTWSLGHVGTAMECLAVAAVCIFVSSVGSGPQTVLAPLVFSFCIYIFAHESGAISKALRSDYFQRLGRWSYSVYMIHWFLLMILMRAVSAIEKWSGIPIRMHVEGYTPKLYYMENVYLVDLMATLYLSSVVIIAAISYRFIEDPARRFFNRLAAAIPPHNR